MALHIEFTVGDCDKRELDALAALIASLGGRAPDTGSVSVGGISLGGLTVEQIGDLIPKAVVTNEKIVIEPKGDAPPPPPAADAPEPPAADAPPPPAGDAPMPPPPEGVVVDARGFPHDLRIHASTGTRKGDDTWTYKRGLQTDDSGKALIAQVEAELRQTMSALVPDAPEPPAHTDPAAAFGDAPPPPSGDAPPPPTGDAPPPPPATDDTAIGEFARVMRIVLAKQAGGTLTTEATTKIANDIGLPSMKDLRNRPDLIPAFEALLP